MANFSTETTLTANGSTNPIGYEGYLGLLSGTFWASGTFGGGTLTLECSRDGGTTWLSCDRGGTTITTFTSNSVGNFQLNAKYKVRATLTGATSPNIYIGIDGQTSDNQTIY
jgi:hypothetical protein